MSDYYLAGMDMGEGVSELATLSPGVGLYVASHSHLVTKAAIHYLVNAP